MDLHPAVEKTKFDTAKAIRRHSFIKILRFRPGQFIIEEKIQGSELPLTLFHVDLYSDVLGRSVEAEVILPKAKPGEGSIKTLFLLHGMTDDHTVWQRRTSIERYADEKHLAVVMPSTQLGFYANAYAGERWFDYISDELVHAMRRMFPGLSRRREDTFVAGLSMGGFGALKCALLKPETFSRCAVLSGALDAGALALNPLPLGKPYRWEDVFGPRHAIPGSENDLFHAAARLKENRPEIWMWCGTEDELYPMNLKMRNHLRELGYPLSFHDSPGDHTWKYWNREIQNVLKWLVPGEEDEACP